MKFLRKLCLVFLPAFAAAGCQTAPNGGVTTSPPIETSSPSRGNEIVQMAAVVDVPRMAGKTTAEIDNVLGKPEIAKPITEPAAGEYRVYRIQNHPKGLAVRFYGDQAVDFNLILSKPLPTAKRALKEIFNIDVGEASPQIDSKEPLSEVWRGAFNGVRFAKVYAKRERENGGFIFVLAEIAR